VTTVVTGAGLLQKGVPSAYSPGKGFLGSDYFETRFEYEMLNGSLASAVLKAGIEVVPHF
jgi:hypothetical protein